MIESVLALTGLAFWTVVIGTVLLSFIVMALVEFNRPFWATVVFAVCIAGAVVVTRYPIWEEIKANPLLVLYWFFGYLLLGVVWSIFKWTRYVRRIVNGWVRTENRRNLEHIRSAKTDEDVELPREIDPGYNKDRFFGWTMYWPFSAAWTVLDDPLRSLFEVMYEQFGQIYTKLAKRIARRIAMMSVKV